MGFFAASKNADALLEELNKKIDIAKQELAKLEEEIKEFDRQHEQE
jgi:prefoldin subunit 5